MERTQRTYSFKEGQKISLDQIYDIQALAGGDWWMRDGEDLPESRREKDIDFSESLVCTRTVKITIVVETPNAEVSGAGTASAGLPG